MFRVAEIDAGFVAVVSWKQPDIKFVIGKGVQIE